jgi:hypothetical protein
MVSKYKKSGGWFSESQRHSLSAKGIKTKIDKAKNGWFKNMFIQPDEKRVIFDIYNSRDEFVEEYQTGVKNKRELMKEKKELVDSYYSSNPNNKFKIFLNKKKSAKLDWKV